MKASAQNGGYRATGGVAAGGEGTGGARCSSKWLTVVVNGGRLEMRY